MCAAQGVTFACVNAAKPAEGGTEKSDTPKPAESGAETAEEPVKASGEPSAEPKQAAEELKLATFAFRVKERARLDEFMEAVEAHKTKAAEVHSACGHGVLSS